MNNSQEGKEFLSLLIKIIAIVLVFFFLFTFVFGVTRYQEPSMNPAIKDGDLVFYYRLGWKEYDPGETIVLHYEGKTQVRRVIAVEGDIIDITKDGLEINGALQQEYGIYNKTESYQEGINFPVEVPEGCVFVLGDDRLNATDSRIYGCLEVSKIKGRVMTIIRRRNI